MKDKRRKVGVNQPVCWMCHTFYSYRILWRMFEVTFGLYNDLRVPTSKVVFYSSLTNLVPIYFNGRDGMLRSPMLEI